MAGQGITQGRQPCGCPVQRIIETRRRPAETAVALGPVAPHGIQGVGQAIDQNTGRSCHQKPEEGAKEGVIAVLQYGFDRRLGDGRLVEVGRVATDQIAHCLAGPRQVTLGQGIAYPTGMFRQAAPADGEIEEQDVPDGAPGPPVDEEGNQGQGQDERHQGQGTPPDGIAPETVFQGLRQPTEAYQGVQVARLPQPGIQGQGRGQEQGIGKADHERGADRVSQAWR